VGARACVAKKSCHPPPSSQAYRKREESRNSVPFVPSYTGTACSTCIALDAKPDPCSRSTVHPRARAYSDPSAANASSGHARGPARLRPWLAILRARSSSRHAGRRRCQSSLLLRPVHHLSLHLHNLKRTRAALHRRLHYLLPCSVVLECR